jgi:hypothetical protein
MTDPNHFTFKELNPSTLRVFYRGIDLGRLYFRPVQKNEKPVYTVVDMNELDVIRDSQDWHKIKTPSKDKMKLAILMLEHRKIKKVA